MSQPKSSSSSSSSSRSSSSSQSRRSGKFDDKKVLDSSLYPNDLIINEGFKTSMPDVPFDLKFLKFEPDPMRFVRYRPSSLEKSFKSKQLTKSNLNIPINLVDSEAYTCPRGAKLHPDDEALLKDIKKKDDTPISYEVGWLKKPEFMAIEHALFGVKGSQMHQLASQDINVEDIAPRDRASQFAAIEKTFDSIQDRPLRDFRHPKKKNLKAVSAIPVLPDFENWGNRYAFVSFGNDPKPNAGDTNPDSVAFAREQLKSGILLSQESDNQPYVSYYVPTEDTIVERKRRAEEGADDTEDATKEENYQLLRDYNFFIHNYGDLDGDSHVFFLKRDNAVHYNTLISNVKLRTRRTMNKDEIYEKATHAKVKSRSRTARENNLSRKRRKTCTPDPSSISDSESEGEDEPESVFTQVANHDGDGDDNDDYGDDKNNSDLSENEASDKEMSGDEPLPSKDNDDGSNKSDDDSDDLGLGDSD